MAAPVLEIRNLTVSVGRRKIVSGLDLVVDAGEVHVLMGPNGSGKTTILMAVMGMPGYRVTEGQIRFRGTMRVGWRRYNASSLVMSSTRSECTAHTVGRWSTIHASRPRRN